MEVMNIREFNVMGDGLSDDTDAIQEAIIFCAKNKQILRFDGATYCCNTVTLLNNSNIDFNNTTIKCLGQHLFHNFLNDSPTCYGNIVVKNGTIIGGTVACLMHGKNIVFENINAKDTLTNHFFEICACKNVAIKNGIFRGTRVGSTTPKEMEMIHLPLCTYADAPWMDNPKSQIYDNTMNERMLIQNCLFDRSSEPGFETIYTAIGNHTTNRRYHKNIMILNCIIKNAMIASIQAKNWKVAKVIENQFLDSKEYVFENCKRVKLVNNQSE